MNSISKNPSSIEGRLTQRLNTQGFSFQYAVINAAETCFKDNKSPWLFEAAEFPVVIKEIPTHVDFILSNQNEPFFLIAECKRANPALSNWCFLKTPFVSRNTISGERIVRETINLDPRNSHDPPLIRLDWLERSNDIYRLVLEVKSDLKGDSNLGRGQINDAISQSLRGLNGLIHLFMAHFNKAKQLLRGAKFTTAKYAAFMPVIFTTANIWVSDVDLSIANLENGNIDVSDVALTPKDWIYFNYSQSPNLKHSFSGHANDMDISDMLYYEFSRTIPIVSSAGIESFLRNTNWWEPSDWKREALPTKR